MGKKLMRCGPKNRQKRTTYTNYISISSRDFNLRSETQMNLNTREIHQKEFKLHPVAKSLNHRLIEFLWCRLILAQGLPEKLCYSEGWRIPELSLY